MAEVRKGVEGIVLWNGGDAGGRRRSGERVAR